MPKAMYTGATAQAVLDDTDAYAFQQTLFTGIQYLRLNLPTASLPARTYDETIPGSSGSATITGIIHSDHTGWIQETLADYVSSDAPGIVENGVVDIFEGKPSGEVTLGFDSYSVTAGGVTYVYNGSITSNVPFDGVDNKLVGSVSVSLGTEQLFLSGLTISGGTFNPDTLSGKIYESSLGYVSIDTVTPGIIGGSYVSTDFPNIYFDGSGEVKLKGASGTSLDVQLLNDYFLYLGLDSDGDGNIDEGARLDRTTGALDAVQPAGTTVSPLIEAPNQVTATGPVALDGRYSYAPGGSFVTYSWSLLAAPLGSTVTVSGTGPTAQFTPDIPGDYLVQLTATSGGKSAFDVMPVNFSGQPPTLDTAPATQYKVPSYVHTQVGQSVTLDGRASPALSPLNDQDGVTWTLHAPTGSHAKLANRDAVTSFTPDVAGMYYVVLGPDDPGSLVPASAVSVIAAGEDLRLAPPGVVAANLSSDPATGKFGSSQDSLVMNADVSSALQMQWWTWGSDGLFTEGGSIDPSNEWDPLLAADLNGDGVADLVSASTSGVANCPLDLRISGSGSYTLNTVSFAPYCNDDAGVEPMHLTTLGGHPAVIAEEGTFLRGSNIVAFPTDGSGTPGTPVVTAFGYPRYVIDFGLADLDGDSKTDLVALTGGYTVGSLNSIDIYKGDDAGNFTLKGSIAPTGTPSAIATGDFNGDGKQDIAVLSGTTVYLYFGDGSGGLGNMDSRTLSCDADFLEAVDLNNDGHLDLVVDNSGFCSISATDKAVSSLGLLLSHKVSGKWSLGKESPYAMPQTNESIGAPVRLDSAATGDYLANGFQGLMLRVSGNLMFMPQLPSVTSATIDRASTAPSRKSSTVRPDSVWHHPLAKRKAPLLRPDAAPRQ